MDQNKIIPGSLVEIPQDTDAEMALLGSMLCGNDAVDDVLPIVFSGSDFYVPANGRLFEVIKSMHESSMVIDLITVENELKHRGVYEEIGGRDYILTLNASFGDFTRAAHYARVVAEKRQRRLMMKVAIDLYSEAASPLTEANEMPAKYAKRLDEIGEAKGTSDAEDMRGIMFRVADKIRNGAGTEFIHTGMHAIDEKVGGLEFPSFIIVAARPSVGKTAIGLAWCINAVRNGIDTVFISIEMTKERMAMRTLTHTTGIPLEVIKNNYSPDDIAAMADSAVDSLGPGRFIITERVTNVREACAMGRSYARKGFKLIALDYLQLCQPAERKENRTNEVGSVSADLKRLNKANGVTVMAMAQLSREFVRSGKAPRLHDLRDSGSIEQDADMVFMLHTPEANIQDSRPPCSVILEKNRNGPLAAFPMIHTKALGRFEMEKF